MARFSIRAVQMDLVSRVTPPSAFVTAAVYVIMSQGGRCGVGLMGLGGWVLVPMVVRERIVYLGQTLEEAGVRKILVPS